MTNMVTNELTAHDAEPCVAGHVRVGAVVMAAQRAAA